MSLAEIAAACEGDTLERVTHSVIDSICSRKYPRVVDYGKVVSPSQWRQLATTLTAILKKFGRLESFDLDAQLQEAGIAADKTKGLAAAAAARRPELRKALLAETSAIATASIVDFDWNVSVAYASDSLATINETLMMLTLKIRQPGIGVKDTEVKMELSRPELQALIAKLDAADKVVQSLSA